MKDRTKANVHTAYVGESKAVFRLRAFAKKADEEDYPQLARLFRAIAESESVHAENYFRLLEEVGTSEENVKRCFETEMAISERTYPKFLKEAIADQEPAALWFFECAVNTEARHAKLYRFAAQHMVMDRLVSYYVCQNCGWTADEKCPDQCPNCGKLKDFFKEIN